MDQIDAASFFRVLAIPGVTAWQDTPLGRPETWSEGLRLAVHMMIGAPAPVIITIKPSGLVYNATFATLIGNLHPEAFGSAADMARIPRRPGPEWRLAGRRFTVVNFELPGAPHAILSMLFPLQAAPSSDGKTLRELAEGPRADMLGINYQPQIRLSDDKTIGFEALARWYHPEQGAIDPGYFIELAERSDLILEIGDWVVSRALADITACHDCRLLRVAINVSPLQLRDPRFPIHVARTLAESGLPASCLELEITESVLIERGETAAHSLAALRELGVSLSLDDFGTGYSNMTTLERFRFDRLKLDRSFLRSFPSERGQILIRSAVEMAHRLGMEVVGEGIETEAQVDFLRDVGCDYGQGYLYAPPMKLGEAVAWKNAREAGRTATSRLQSGR